MKTSHHCYYNAAVFVVATAVAGIAAEVMIVVAGIAAVEVVVVTVARVQEMFDELLESFAVVKIIPRVRVKQNK